MHAFVDFMDFKDKSFLGALRFYLEHFRLPGESQKIDRFMLKFAEKYVTDNPDTVFANAEAVYILSYSVIMLNTDQHNSQVKNPMTLDGFIANNRGINDGGDFPVEFLQEIYAEIQNDEIKLSSEQHAFLISKNFPVQSTGLFGGKDLTKEAYLKASKEMASKTEQTVRGLRRSGGRNPNVVFYSAAASNTAEYVKSIFDNIWMSVLAGLTAPFREYDDEDTAKVLLEGIKISIHIACTFGLADARTSFIRALVQFSKPFVSVMERCLDCFIPN
ncbi:unnamed protein product [Ambrosiozyma monospora]|uniref:Unnamed protein product n=1 Tax=Ambrosiozyma monospora TaxID=43982 RepID=A0ACB5TXI5_AMBMO|nr:unnamed protein product [Ambrosiozyma monospora]